MDMSIESMADHHDAVPHRSSLEMAAIMLLGLGEGPAAQVLKKMPASDVIRLSRAMNQLDDVSMQELEYVSGKVLRESERLPVLTDRDYVQRTLRRAVGDKKANSLMQSVTVGEFNPVLERLAWLEPELLADAVRHEHPQLQAVLLACLDPDRSAEVLSLLPQEQQQDVVRRLVSLNKIPAASIDAIGALLETVDDQVCRSHTIDGVGQLAEILNHVEESTGDYLMEHLRHHNDEVAEQVASLRFTFEHLLLLDEQPLRLILEKTGQDVLALALKGLSQVQINKVFACMTQRAAGYVRDEMDSIGQVRLSRVMQARRDILNTARTLEVEGAIEVSLGTEELIN